MESASGSLLVPSPLLCSVCTRVSDDALDGGVLCVATGRQLGKHVWILSSTQWSRQNFGVFSSSLSCSMHSIERQDGG